MSVRDRVNPHIRELKPYSPGKPVEELERELGISESVKLASNEHAAGPSPRVADAIRACADQVHVYPDGASHELRAALAAKLGIAGESLVFGCGADELLELLAKTLLGPGDQVVYPWPSFAMYPLVVQGMGAEGVAVPLDSEFRHDLEAMLDAVNGETKLLFLCNPNNPTGLAIDAAAFDRFMERVPDHVVVAIDEAYGEFANPATFPDAVGWMQRRPGTIVLRTFSKAYGLAGLRVGYGIADSELAGYLERARHPFNVNRLAEVAALAALGDESYLATTIKNNAEGREFLSEQLAKRGYDVWPSSANFVLVRTGPGVYEPLLRKGVIVRPLGGFGLEDCVRVTVGTRRANEVFIRALDAVEAERS